MNSKPILTATAIFLLYVCGANEGRSQQVPKSMLGDWSLSLDSGEPAWMSVTEKNGKGLVYLRIYVGPDGPYEVTKSDGQAVEFTIRPKRKPKNKTPTQQEVTMTVRDDQLVGQIRKTGPAGVKQIQFTGDRIPPMPPLAPVLSDVKFGKPISLFNGKNLDGWRTYETDKKNGWSVKDGVLVNTTPKTDFSETGDYANLRTIDEFEDFRLHIEFLVEKDRNSGIYLRGMYEAQVVDRDSRMQGIQGVGAIFGRIAPTKNAGKAGGQWQTYDLTLVNRHITVVLNGETVIDNKPVIGPTAGAIYTNPAKPGPIYLQGDHTNVKYRNIDLEPVLKP